MSRQDTHFRGSYNAGNLGSARNRKEKVEVEGRMEETGAKERTERERGRGEERIERKSEREAIRQKREG